MDTTSVALLEARTKRLAEVMKRRRERTLQGNFQEIHDTLSLVYSPSVGGVVPGALPPLGGDLSGPIGAAVIDKIKGKPIEATPPGDQEVLTYDALTGTLMWLPGSGGGSATIDTRVNEALVPKGASATASSQLVSGPVTQVAEYAIDNDGTTEWDTVLPVAGSSGAAGGYLVVDLGAAKVITWCRVVQSANSSYRATSSKLQSSTDAGVTWTDRVTFGIFNDSGLLQLPTPVTAQHWRVLGIAGTVNNPYGLRAVELYSGAVTQSAPGHVIQDEGTPLTSRAALDFVGPIVAATDGPGDKTTVTLTDPVPAHAAAADPHTGYQKETERGVANGYAALGADALVPQDQLGTGTQDGTRFLRDDGTWQTVSTAGLTIQELDGTPSGIPTALKFQNGVITDNGDGTYTVASSSGLTNILTAAGDLITAITNGTGTDAAPSGTATASTTNAGHVASNAIDNNITTAWWANTVAEQTLQVDLGSAQTIYGFQYIHDSAAVAVNKFDHYWIEYSALGVSWTTLYTSASGLSGISNSGIVTFVTPTSARFWRIRGATTGANGLMVAQFSLFSAISAPTPVVQHAGAIGDTLRTVDNGSGTGVLGWVTIPIYSGSGAPATSLGAVGSYYFRTDTPSTANQRIYVKTGVSTWTGIV